MRRIFLICLSLIIFGTSRIVFAQQLNTKLFVGPQDPITKEIEIKAIVDSDTASNRVSINWSLPGNLKTDAELIDNESVVKEGSNEFTILATPSLKVDGYVEFNLQIFDGDKRYSTAQIGKIKTDELLNVLPINQSYKQIYNLTQAGNLLQILFIIIFISLIVIYIARKLLEKTLPTKLVSTKPLDSLIMKELSRSRLT